MMLNNPMFDWLTLTTFEIDSALKMRYLHAYDSYTPASRLQYKGVQGEGVFFGEATQGGRQHWMFQASGEMADYVFMGYPRDFGPYDWNVTRCDLQVTIPIPPRFSSRDLYDDLQIWDGPGKPRISQLLQSGDGNDTVYVGSRSSDRFTRIYVKPIDGGLKALRFECEYKGEHAHRVFQDCIAEPRNRRFILGYEVRSLPMLSNSLKTAFLRVLGAESHKPKIDRVTSQSATLDWLRTQVHSTIMRALNDHEIGHEVERLVAYWHNYPDCEDLR